MDSNVIGTIIAAVISILGAAMIFYLTKRHELRAKWQQEKLEHYKSLLSAISDLAIEDSDKRNANLRFASSVNTITLVAPQYVIDALMEFHNEIKFSNPNRSNEGHDKKLIHLLLAIRKDIGLTQKDIPEKFNYHLVGSGPPKTKRNT